jgi:hypothetical protein
MRPLPVRVALAAIAGVSLLVACASGTGGGSGSASSPKAVETVAGSTAAASAATTSAGGGGAGGTAGTDPCSLATPEMVAAAFGGSSSPGVPGTARNCTFKVTGASVPNVDAFFVDVFYYGTAAEWDGIRAGFESNRGGTTDVPGIGSKAFHPNDAGPTELVILAGDTVYSVSGGFGASDEVNADVAELATAIAGTLGS